MTVLDPELLIEPVVVPPVRAHSVSTVLRRPAFSLLVVGQTLSQLGDKLHHMALIALVGVGATGETGGIELAKLSVVFTAPAVLFSPLAGALVDRLNKRTTMILADALRAILVLLIPWLYSSTGSLAAVYAVAFFVFVLGVFFNSAKMALIPDLVEREALLPANAALTFVGRFATVVGIVGGGLIIGAAFWQRLGWSAHDAGFYLDGASYLVSVATLIGLAVVSRSTQSRETEPLTPPAQPRPTLASLVSDVRTTIKLVARHTELRFVFYSMMALALFASTVYVVMTYAVQTLMGKGTAGVGYLGGLLGAGMIVGSLVVGTIGQRFSRAQIIVWCVGLTGVLMVVAGLLFSFVGFLPVAFLGGLVLAPITVSQDTMLHEHAPAGSRALVFSTKDLVLAASFAVSAFLVGGGVLVMDALGASQPYRVALFAVGGVIVLGAIATEVMVLRSSRGHVPIDQIGV